MIGGVSVKTAFISGWARSEIGQKRTIEIAVREKRSIKYLMRFC
jgi:hypothetical protein